MEDELEDEMSLSGEADESEQEDQQEDQERSVVAMQIQRELNAIKAENVDPDAIDEGLVAACAVLINEQVAENRRERGLGADKDLLSEETSEIAREFSVASTHCIGVLQEHAPLCEPASLRECGEDDGDPRAMRKVDISPEQTGSVFDSMLSSLYAKANHGLFGTAEVSQVLAGCALLASSGEPSKMDELRRAVDSGAGESGHEDPDDLRRLYAIGRAVCTPAIQAFLDAQTRMEAEAEQLTIDAQAIVEESKIAARSGGGRWIHREQSPRAIPELPKLVSACKVEREDYNGYRSIEQVLLCASGVPCFNGTTGTWHSALEVALDQGFFEEDDAADILEAAYCVLYTVNPELLDEKKKWALELADDQDTLYVCLLVHRSTAWMCHLERIFRTTKTPNLSDSSRSEKFWQHAVGRSTYRSMTHIVNDLRSGRYASFDWSDSLDHDYWAFVDKVLTAEEGLRLNSRNRQPLAGREAAQPSLAVVASTALSVVGCVLAGMLAAGLVATAYDPKAVGEAAAGAAVLGWDVARKLVDAVQGIAEAEIATDKDSEAIKFDLLTKRESQVVYTSASLGFVLLLFSRLQRGNGQGHDWVSDIAPLADTVYKSLVYTKLSSLLASLRAGPYVQRLLEQTAKSVIMRSTTTYLQDALSGTFSGPQTEPVADLVIPSLGRQASPGAVRAAFGLGPTTIVNARPKVTALARALPAAPLIVATEKADITDLLKAALARATAARHKLEHIDDD